MLPTSDKMTGFTPSLTWTRNTIGGPVATITLPEFAEGSYLVMATRRG